jgi:alkylation response protein AidB-like acyl-CoA dehydrogenase
VFFDQVRVPTRQVVGEIDEGWEIAKALLGFERSMIGAAVAGQMRGAERELLGAARAAHGSEDGALPDPLLRDALAAYAMREACYHGLLDHIAAQRRRGDPPGPEASIAKLVGSELKQQRYDLAMAINGNAGLGWEGAGFAAQSLQTSRDWLRSRANSIEGGTSEIHLNIIAHRILGLPK